MKGPEIAFHLEFPWRFSAGEQSAIRREAERRFNLLGAHPGAATKWTINITPHEDWMDDPRLARDGDPVEVWVEARVVL